jgi:hypothetical protein
MYFCVSYDSQNKMATIYLNNINQFIIVMRTRFLYFSVGIQMLNII